MKSNYLIKSTPLLSILVIIILLNITNKVNDAKLKILIWNTPKLSLGTYLAISSATGFAISYLITSNLARINYIGLNKSFRYKTDYEEYNSNNIIDRENKPVYPNTLFERDIKDPSPTMNASFRVISNSPREIKYSPNIDSQEEPINNFNKKPDDLFLENEFIDDKLSESKKNKNDWYDDTFADW